MGEIINLFSADEPSPTTHSVESANKLLPAVRKCTEEAIKRAEELKVKLQYLEQTEGQSHPLKKQYDELVLTWVEKIHRLGGMAKGLWLVDFDTGAGYLCWSYPEEKVEHFHPYDGSYKTRTKIV